MEDSHYKVNRGQRVRLNIRGRHFEVTASTLRNIPNTRLSTLDKNSNFYDVSNDEYFFDRDPDVFNSILNLYIMGKLHIPKNICGAVMREEMKFWKISHQKVSECCLRIFYQLEEDQGMIEEIKRAYEYTDTLQTGVDWKIKAWLMFDQPGSSLLAKVIIFCTVNSASKKNFARRNKTALGPLGQAETSLKIEDFS